MEFPDQIESAVISAAVGLPGKPPVDLRRIVAELGVVDVRRIHCRNAFTHFEPTGPVIYLDQTVSGAQERFVIAHELAHIMLRTPAVIEMIENRGQADLLTDEEEFANRIARALLVPDEWIEEMKKTSLMLVRWEKVAFLAGIPMSMLITRMATAGIDIALLHWRRGSRSWHVIDRPGTPLFLHGYIELSEIGRRTMDYLSGQESRVTVDCRINGSHVGISGRGYKLRDCAEQAFQFLAPKHDVWLLMR